MSTTKKVPKKFPCECGKGFDTALEFSDHVHDDHYGEAVFFAPRAAENLTKQGK